MSTESSTKRVIPLTPPGPLWSQREYVAAMGIGIHFAAHRAGPIEQWFHYGFPDDIGCTSVRVGAGEPKEYVDHEFPRQIGWLELCRVALATRSKR